MVNKPKNIGTAAESAVRAYAQKNGFPWADRRPLKGNKDEGDILFSPGFIGEVKGGDRARYASDQQVSRWLVETWTERLNAEASLAVLVMARWRKPVERWWAVAPSLALELEGPSVEVRMYLGDFLTYARHLGYGTPLEEAA